MSTENKFMTTGINQAVQEGWSAEYIEEVLAEFQSCIKNEDEDGAINALDLLPDQVGIAILSYLA